MTDLPSRLFANPAWQALQAKHRHLAVSAGDARRYPAEVAPFAAVVAPTPAALQHLHSLLAPGESVWLVGENYLPAPELSIEETLECLQMVLPEEVMPPDATIEMVSLSAANAAEMVALTELAFPGFFRQRTCEMGSYYGVRSEQGELIAMGGERLMLDGYSEISGVCTHPAHRGKSLAASLIWTLVRNHRRDGVVSWLHVGSANRHARELYLRMGFKVAREIALTGSLAIGQHRTGQRPASQKGAAYVYCCVEENYYENCGRVPGSIPVVSSLWTKPKAGDPAKHIAGAVAYDAQRERLVCAHRRGRGRADR